MKVKGILVEGRDGEEYLLGFELGPAQKGIFKPMLMQRRFLTGRERGQWDVVGETWDVGGEKRLKTYRSSVRPFDRLELPPPPGHEKIPSRWDYDDCAKHAVLTALYHFLSIMFRFARWGPRYRPN